MLIETTAGDLRIALEKVKPGIERGSMPILQAVLLSDGGVTTTNLDYEIRVKFAAKRFTGACAVPFHQLHDLLKRLPKQTDIRIQATEHNGYGVYVLFEGARYYLPSFTASDFPVFSYEEQPAPMAKPDGLINALRICQPFISTEDTRYYLNGICFSKDAEGNGVVVATDGHRLGAVPYAHELNASVILPRTVLPALFGLSEPESVFVGKLRMEFTYPGGGWVKTKLIDGVFPDWLRVVPNLAPDAPRLKFSPKEMYAVLRRMDIARTRHRTSIDICATATGDLVTATCKGMDGEECAERLEQGYAANWSKLTSSVISFNSGYLKQVCSLNLDAEEVTLTTADASSPALIDNPDSKTLMILMPMRGDGSLAGQSLLTLARKSNDSVAAGQVAA
ncbi:MAG: hypothetical protein K5905_23075 [Roseibium sp.]|uniref:DNA polymerase III subunit beta n=1 Tax=Roseibium sp. TaxID=1936156 RepID=UPI00262A6FA6|nr:hypothetical protein [Roseibium sp.]MCV0428350.1 hypothetical protein [Roseibium sp.]